MIAPVDSLPHAFGPNTKALPPEAKVALQTNANTNSQVAWMRADVDTVFNKEGGVNHGASAVQDLRSIGEDAAHVVTGFTRVGQVADWMSKLPGQSRDRRQLGGRSAHACHRRRLGSDGRAECHRCQRPQARCAMTVLSAGQDDEPVLRCRFDYPSMRFLPTRAATSR